MTITPTRTPDPTRQDPRTTREVAPVHFDLLRSDSAAALVQDGRTVSHAELTDLVEQRRKELGPVRRLVVLDGASTVEAVVDHLACLAGGHAAIMVAPGAPSAERLVAAYDPDVVVRHRQGRETEIRRDGSAHELHPDLALLMSTSGSSGSPKLVRTLDRQPACQRLGHRRLPRPRRRRLRRDLAATALLLRPFGPALTPAGRSKRLADRRVGRSTTRSGTGSSRSARPHSPVSRTRSSSSSRPTSSADSCLASTGCGGSPKPVGRSRRRESRSGPGAVGPTASTSS